MSDLNTGETRYGGATGLAVAAGSVLAAGACMAVGGLDSIPAETLHQEIKELRPQMERRARRMSEAPQVEEALEYSRELETAITANASVAG